MRAKEKTNNKMCFGRMQMVLSHTDVGDGPEVGDCGEA